MSLTLQAAWWKMLASRLWRPRNPMIVHKRIVSWPAPSRLFFYSENAKMKLHILIVEWFLRALTSAWVRDNKNPWLHSGQPYEVLCAWRTYNIEAIFGNCGPIFNFLKDSFSSNFHLGVFQSLSKCLARIGLDAITTVGSACRIHLARIIYICTIMGIALVFFTLTGVLF